MLENQKYHYLKLKEKSFEQPVIVLLENLKDGHLYLNILLKLYLKSLGHDGKLQLDNNLSYTLTMLATLTHQSIATTEKAINAFIQLGLMEVLSDGSYCMMNLPSQKCFFELWITGYGWNKR